MLLNLWVFKGVCDDVFCDSNDLCNWAGGDIDVAVSVSHAIGCFACDVRDGSRNNLTNRVHDSRDDGVG